MAVREVGEAIYVPTEDERRVLVEALEAINEHPDALREWTDVRSEVWPPAVQR